MIYMVDHVFGDPALEPAWHEWYAGYLKKLLSVPGIHSAQRFKAIGCTPSRYLAMYSIESADVYESAAYKGIGGGGSQSARFHPAYRLWTRNLFEGAERAPAVGEDERVLVLDAPHPDPLPAHGARGRLERPNSPSPRTRGEGWGEGKLTWVRAVGLHMTTPYRGFMVLQTGEPAPELPGSFVYAPFTPPLEQRR